jgi:hypothetical protein
VNSAVLERSGEGVVDEAVLVDEGQALETAARDDDLEVVAAAGTVGDGDLGRVRKRLPQKLLESLVPHIQIVSSDRGSISRG